MNRRSPAEIATDAVIVAQNKVDKVKARVERIKRETAEADAALIRAETNLAYALANPALPAETLAREPETHPVP